MNGAIDYFTHERDGGLDWNRDGVSVREEGYSTFLLGAETIRLIKQRDKSRPFFHYLPFNAPHAPLQAPPDYIDRYANIKDEKRRRYAAMTEAMDATVGKVLAALDEEGIADNTLVLFFSDNGGPTGSGATNTPLRAGKGTAFEGGIRVPAIMRWPGHLKAGTTSQQVMTMMDYFPTLAGAVGVKPGNTRPLDGKNLWPSITGGKVEPRDDIYFAVETDGAMRFGVHHREWKLVREVPHDGGEAKNYLFHIEEDPTEKNDLADKNPKLVADLVQGWNSGANYTRRMVCANRTRSRRATRRRSSGWKRLSSRGSQRNFRPTWVCRGEFACELITPNAVAVTRIRAAETGRIEGIWQLRAKLYPQPLYRRKLLEYREVEIPDAVSRRLSAIACSRNRPPRLARGSPLVRNVHA